MIDLNGLAPFSLSLITQWNQFDSLETLLEIIGELSTAITIAKERIPLSKPGRPAKVDGRILVRQLADLWFEATGELPRRRHDTFSDPPSDYGPFRDFVRMASRQGNPSGAGLDDLIREVVKNLGKKRRNHPKKR